MFHTTRLSQLDHVGRAAALFVLASCFVATGCASTAMVPHIRPHPGEDGELGPKDIEKIRGTTDHYNRLQRHHVDISRDHVLVLDQVAPEGIDVHKAQLRVSDEYDHEPILQFRLEPGATGPWVLGQFRHFRKQWRRSYCHPQVPLNWATLTTWSFLSPLASPCWSNSLVAPEDFWGDVRRLTRAAGGDLAIVSVLRDQKGRIAHAAGFVLDMDPEFTVDSFDVHRIPNKDFPPM